MDSSTITQEYLNISRDIVGNTFQVTLCIFFTVTEFKYNIKLACRDANLQG